MLEIGFVCVNNLHQVPEPLKDQHVIEMLRSGSGSKSVSQNQSHIRNNDIYRSMTGTYQAF